ncbi:BrxA/BrxB family bacilliredoxin [Bacillus sp. FJAT-45350]|uniref:BrxA/BrxB family bacilliredoxin n=1 Tax=Bacillus sp. FJAT-45350 TaxID=2011014 RepID=UPI000BB90CE4|nr:BrxA/BrxB family bacilliredoxin [Bacillus sp. FJAT-45350]
MSMHYDDYMRQVVKPMREELTAGGYKELTTAEEVESFMESAEGTTFVVINSVCGCAAGLARPAAVASLNHDAKPDNMVTVFAGQDKEATAKMRSYFDGYAPSSPSMALLKGKEVVHFIPREEIESYEREEILDNILQGFDKYCK